MMEEFEESFIPRITHSYHDNHSIVLSKSEKEELDKDVKSLRKNLGFISNKQTIINVLCNKSNLWRVEIAKAYKDSYDRDLTGDVKKKFSGSNFSKLVCALLTPIYDFYTSEVYEALNEVGVDEDCLILLCTLRNREIIEISQRYMKLYGKTIEKDIRSETTGNFRKLLLSIVKADRDDSNILDLYNARVDAMELKRSSSDSWGTDSSIFSRIFCLRNFDQLKLIRQEFEYITGHPLENDIKKEFTGDICDALLSILRYANDSSEFFARCFHKAIVGKLDRKTIRLITIRSEIDIEDIKNAYKKKYNETLKNAIKFNTTGHYQKALLALIGE